MLEKYIPKRFATAMIKHVIAATLFFPYIYSHNENWYYQDFVLPNFFAILAMVFIFTSWKLDFKRNAIFVSGLGILLLAYNICATYMNVKYHHWYGEQINVTIAFLFFIVLLLVKDSHALIDTATIKATIHMIVASNVLSICFRLLTGYNRIIIINDWVRLETYSESTQAQFAWLYGHKSEYGLLLVLCVAFFVTYRKLFKNLYTYALSLGVLFIALYISDSFTAMGAAFLILVGQLLDYLLIAKWRRKIITSVILGIPGILGCLTLYNMIDKNRDLLTLGTRTLIWKASWENITNNPNGITDFIMGTDNFVFFRYPNGWQTAVTSNCHNVFLNQMFRFSIPVGIIFTVLIILIMIITLKKNLHFTNFFIWLAILILMTMDYSLFNIELPFFLVEIFICFFVNNKKRMIPN